MHFVTGGAYNGKRKWVKNHYETAPQWLSAYEGDHMDKAPDSDFKSLVVLEGMEQWIRAAIHEDVELSYIRKNMENVLLPWLQWEGMSSERKLVIIGTDISKGIVPIEKRDRLWRDIVGWIYQDIAAQAARVDVIWYGIGQRIK